RYRDEPLADVEPQVMSGLVALLVFRQPYHPGIGAATARLAALIERMNDAPLRIRIAGPLLTYYLWTGDLHRGGLLIERLRDALGTNVHDVPDRLLFMLLDAAFSWHAGRFTHALSVSAAGLALGETSGFRMLDGRISAQGLYARLAAEHLAGSEQILKEAEAEKPVARRLDRSHYHHQASWFCLITEDVVRAEHHGRKALALANQSGCVFPRALCHLFLGFVMIDLERFRDARGHIHAGWQIADAIRSRVLRYSALLATAYLGLAEGREQDALPALTEALAVGREQQYFSAWGTWRHRVMRRLCAFALAHHIETDYVQELIRVRGFVPDDPASTPEAWPWPVRIRTLGRFQVEIGGVPLSQKGKGQARPLELLKVLIASGGRHVPERRIAAALWPHADGDSAHQSFATTLHRLRRILGHEAAVRLDEGQVSLNPEVVWLDTWALDRIAERSCDRAAPNGIASEPGNDLTTLYRGEFLLDEDAPWALAPRERLRLRFLREHRRVAATLEQPGRWQEALAWHQRGLEVEPLAEEIWRSLMRCHRELGQHNAALVAYRRCEQMITTLLGRPPEPATRQLHHEILRAPG
ncbi:MAG: BTAD domain-containing putative transcriptional regulator, partial [Acidiferrobacteraceae bacterium]